VVKIRDRCPQSCARWGLEWSVVSALRGVVQEGESGAVTRVARPYPGSETSI